MPKSKSKTEKLPPYNSHARTVLVRELAIFPDYQEKINEGYPLRTVEELDEIAYRYKDGLTFEEINIEQAKKSPTIKLKKPTFRKYIQDKLLPKSKGYQVVGKKRMAVFPKDIISHINFLYYFYKIADKKTVDLLLSLFTTDQIGTMSILEAIESNLQSGDLYAGVYHCICFGDANIISTIEHILANKKEQRDKSIKMIEDIDNKFDIINEEIEKLKIYLEQQVIKPSEIPDTQITE